MWRYLSLHCDNFIAASIDASLSQSILHDMNDIKQAPRGQGAYEMKQSKAKVVKMGKNIQLFRLWK